MPDGAILAFECGGLRLGLPCSRIAEIAPDRPAQPVPGAPPSVAGVALLRGRLLTIVDLNAQIGISSPASGPAFLVLLAPPYAHLALRIASDLRLEPASADIELIDVDSAVTDLERAIAHEVSA